MIECLKEFLRPTLCNVKVDWELPHNWCVIRPAPTIPYIVSGQRTNLYTAVVFPDKNHSSPVEETKSSSVKEFWFDEELESCHLGDELQCFKLEKSTLKSLRNDIDALMELNKSQLNLDDAIKNWRETTQFHSTSSDTSTDTEDEYSRFSPPERDQSGITVDNSLNNNAHFKSKTNIVQEKEYLISEDRPKKVFGEMNDVITHYMTNNAHFRSAFYANDIINRTKRENTIDVYKYVNSSSDVNETDNRMDFGWGCVSLTGYIGSDLYRKRIEIPSQPKVCQGVALHQFAAENIFVALENTLERTPDSLHLERSSFVLSKESKSLSSKMFEDTLDDPEDVMVSSSR